jgi:hypothetical protein
MVKLLERHIRSIDQRLIILAPRQADIPSLFIRVEGGPEQHLTRLHEIQRLRGGIYLRDGALQRAQLSSAGLHQTREDEQSWHLMTVDGHDHITACVWYLQHDSSTRVRHLRVHTCPAARLRSWRHTVRKAVSVELARARRDGLRYAEIGGWAVATEHRGTCDGVLLALAAYSLGRVFGGALGLTTATVRHSSSTILRRLGGSPLEADGTTIPPYYDPRYNCVMELLRFDSRRPSSQYDGLIDLLRAQLPTVQVMASDFDATAPLVSDELPAAVIAPAVELGCVAPPLV